jgi:hypothetical protein
MRLSGVRPVRRVTLDFAAWERTMSRALDAFEVGEQPEDARAMPRACRAFCNLAVLPLAAAPCCLWSTLLRCVCCPVQCMRHGSDCCAFACSDNVCTAHTDTAIIAMFDGVNGLRALPAPPRKMCDLTEDERRRVAVLVQRTAVLYERCRGEWTMRRSYEFVDVMAPALVGWRSDETNSEVTIITNITPHNFLAMLAVAVASLK